MRFWLLLVIPAVFIELAPLADAEIVLENRRCRAVLGEDAAWRSVIAKSDGTECCAADREVRIAACRVSGRWRAAVAARRDGDRLTLRFAGVDTRLAYAVDERSDWIAFRLEDVHGQRPTHVRLLCLGTSVAENVGPRLCAGWNDAHTVCLMACGLQTHARARSRGDWASLTCRTQDAPGPRLPGAAAALIVAPTDEVRGIFRRFARTYDLPRNVNSEGRPSSRLPAARRSYWFLRFGEKDVERVLELCRKSGFRQVLMLSHSWCRQVGHYTFNRRLYPHGLEGLKRVVQRLKEAGIRVGMHCYASKISKTDPYVTPVPDRRFWVDRTATLAADIGPEAKRIRTGSDLREWPGSPVAGRRQWEGGVEKHREVVIDDEIIRYRTIGPEEEWNTFEGCERGAWGTGAAAHRAGATCRHYGVDGCIDGYIVDQDTDLLDETTDRLARIFNTCGFEMVYFDGGEDVDRRRFHYYVSNFQAVAMSKFKPRPLVHMGTIMTHRLWHSFTRRGTVDTYLHTIRGRIVAGGQWDRIPSVKEHIDRSVDHLLRCRRDMIPGELGWFGIWPECDVHEGLQLDQIEYLMARSLAYDAPISLQTSFSKMDAHPLTPGVLEIVRAYETLRMSGEVPVGTRRRLRERGKDFILVRSGPGARPQFVEVQELEKPAGDPELRAFVGALDDGAAATLWHYRGTPGRVLVPVDASEVRAVDVVGNPLPVSSRQGGTSVPFGHGRTTLLLEGVSPSEVRRRLAAASSSTGSRQGR